jgi:hypothetical protein
MPESRAARHIDAMGIRVDRTSWKNYSGRAIPEIPVTDIFGMRLPSSVLMLSNLFALAPNGGRIDGADVLKACNFPSALRTSVSRIPAPEDNEMRNSTGSVPEMIQSVTAGHTPESPVSPLPPMATSMIRF